MNFLVLAYDGTDDDAANRRAAAREAHIALSGKIAKEGKLLYGGPLLDDHGAVRGSFTVYDFDSRAELDQHLRAEPFVSGNVWQRIEIQRCNVAERFLARSSGSNGP